MFSTPLLQYEVKDPEAFFAPVYNCMDCDNKITHFFPLDLEPEKQNWNLHDVDKITINPVVIMKIIEKLEATMTSGTDGIPVILLKNCAKSLAKPITAVCQACFDHRQDPVRLKGALVFPSLKEGGKKSDPAAWRPISHT